MLVSALLLAMAHGNDTGSLLKVFWSAPTVAARDAVASEIVASGASFDEVFGQIAGAREYAQEVPRGKLFFEHEINGMRHSYMVLVHEAYDPEREGPGRFELHGGMGAKEWTDLEGRWSPGWRPVEGQIVIIPAGWWDSMWWERSQVENFERILRHVRATWNIDEDRVVLAGVSDGGAAVFFQAMRTPDPWAGYAGFVAPPDRLARADFRPDGQMHVSNLFKQEFHLGYGERDVKVPLTHIESYMQLFEKAGARLDWYVLAGEDHSLSLPPERENEFARFLWGTVRDAFPDELSWATEDAERYGRRAWLVIDELAGSTEVDESAVLPRLGTRLQLRGPTAKRVPWGRVKLERSGNTVRAEAVNVERFRILVSPDEFELDRPIHVEIDGRMAFEERVVPSVATLLHWAARDDDRKRLVAAEIELEVAP